MTQVFQSPPHFPSVSSSSSPCGRLNPNDGSQPSALINSSAAGEDVEDHFGAEEAQEDDDRMPDRTRKERHREGDQLSILTLLIAVFRKSLIGCSSSARSEISSTEIGWPSNVRHVAHVTFDRFDGFLGLPVEFEPEVPKRAPSASANVFGVSTESMQLSFDARGNSVPTILLLMQRHLYAQGGLQAEGIFRITAGNSQEEYVREQLNRGVVPGGVDVHCLAGLIKAWFRELPTGVLDPVSPEQVMQSQSEEECAHLVRLLPPTEAALLDWAINLMADVAQLENLNKMDARNVAMVFAPNMTQLADPLIALMYVVQVMNFLKTLIIKTLREREESIKKSNRVSNPNSFDDENQSSSGLILNNGCENGNDSSQEKSAFAEKPLMESPNNLTEDDSESEIGSKNLSTSTEIVVQAVGNKLLVDCCPCNVVSQVCSLRNGLQESSFTCLTNTLKCSNKVVEVTVLGPLGKNRGTAIVGRLNSRTELVEAWR
ncbi:rho GTPase-activating protein 5-like [Neltuma alba]|uniref:rho GTPase-activating protein 5-like n=1 Tax=Neltuma alba TaxID=207710 RepID=UPI0010A39B7D|nr:rho GTPase-activating protein 5-like [Prosopis alba]